MWEWIKETVDTYIVQPVKRFLKWVCTWLVWAAIIVMIAGILIAIFTSWTIAGIGAGIVIFIVGFVLFLCALVCKYA